MFKQRLQVLGRRIDNNANTLVWRGFLPHISIHGIDILNFISILMRDGFVAERIHNLGIQELTTTRGVLVSHEC